MSILKIPIEIIIDNTNNITDIRIYFNDSFYIPITQDLVDTNPILNKILAPAIMGTLYRIKIHANNLGITEIKEKA